MVTDSTSSIAGNYGQGETITCILEEGAITMSTTGIDPTGRSQTVYTFGSGLSEGDPVALENSTSNTYAATGGLVLVETPQNGEGLVIGRIVGTPTALVASPSTATIATAANTVALRLASKFYRMARVELAPGIAKGSIKKFTVLSDGSNATVPGVGTTLKVSIAGSTAAHGYVLDSAASGGTGLIPLHAVPAGTDGDTCNVLAIITGLMTAVS